MTRLSLLFSLLCALASAEEPAFFPLGLWYEAGVGDVRDNVLPKDPTAAAAVYDKNFADIAAHGINVIVAPDSPPDHHQPLLDAAEKHGLKVILELDLDGGEIGAMIRGQPPFDEKIVRDVLDKKLGPVKDHPALWRVQLLDEPPGAGFATYGRIADIARRYNPRTPAFCCLTGDSDGDKFLAASKSDVVAFDMYPIGHGSRPGDDKPLKDFATYAQRFIDWAAKHDDARSWAVVQCHNITGNLRFPTPEEMRCMTYASLATGNKGVFWFLYQSEGVGQAMMGGLVDREFRPRPLWDEVGRLTKQLTPLLATLAQLKPDRETKITCGAPGVAYALRDGAGKLHVFVINFDVLHPQRIKLTLPSGNIDEKDLAAGAGMLYRAE